MSCGFSEIGLKENMDAVGESITHFARSFDRHTVETRQILQKLFQLLQVSICDDADSKEIMKLTRDYVTSETDLDTEKNAALARIDTLLQTFPDKKKYKDGSSYSVPGRKILEEYLKEPKQELPILSAVADNKERQEKGKTKLMENALAPLNKPTAKEEEWMVKRWSKDSTKEKLSDNHGKQREYKLESKNVEIKKLHFTVDQTKKETESLKCRVSSNMVFDKKVFDNIRAENERLKRETRSVQTEKSELNEKLQNSIKERDIWQQRTLDARSKTVQIMEEKVAIEMKMREIGHKLKVKIDEEKQLTCSLESRSALINEEKCISEKLKEEKEALRREKMNFRNC